MALFAMGDFHLSLSVDRPMEKFGSVWENHVEKIEKSWKRINWPERRIKWRHNVWR